MSRFIAVRLYGFRKLHGFKRGVVASDVDVENKKWCGGNKISREDFNKKGDMTGSDLYYPKYGASIYDDAIISQFKKDNDRED